MTNTKKALTQISKTVTFTPVQASSLVESYAHVGGDLAIRLKNGSAYIYKGVDNATVTGFINAASKGKYFGTNIRNKFVAEQAE